MAREVDSTRWRPQPWALLLTGAGILLVFYGMYQDDVIGRDTSLPDLGLGTSALGVWMFVSIEGARTTARLPQGQSARRFARVLGLAGWGCFAAALLLPAATFGNRVETWEVPGVYVGLDSLFTDGSYAFFRKASLATSLLIGLAFRGNLLDRHWALGAGLVGATVFHLAWLAAVPIPDGPLSLLIGYWVWQASFVTTGAAILLNRISHASD